MNHLPIHALFSVEDRFLNCVQLSYSPGQDFSWSCDGDESLNQVIGCWLEEYLCGKCPATVIPLRRAFLPPFTRRVVSSLSSIPWGTTKTYQEMATLCGNAKGARAVGNACGRNPWPLIVPCHRVVGTNGLGGFSSGGREVKQHLLAFESLS